MVLATLHGFHEAVPAYGFDTLGRTIESLKPDVLCLEVQPGDLQARGPEKVKVEYPRVVYPLIDKHHYRVYAMEPAEPVFSRIVKPYVASARAFQDNQPAQAKAFNAYAEHGLEALKTYWTSPRRVNDATTDAVFAAKHALQTAMIGAGERAGWEAWNEHFREVILLAARENPGKRIVVLVGVEHAYWLRRNLGDLAGIELGNL
ncbi:MAG: hypothetical protein WBW92_03520 [Rhodanobacteraceae bacterium]